MTLQEYIAALKGKTVSVIGIGVSNKPLVDLLCREGIHMTLRDKRTPEQMGTLSEELTEKGCDIRFGPGYLDELHEDVIFRTPGLRPDIPELLAAVKKGSVLTSEMEVFFQVCPCPIIAVTGSDGKTTTTTIISELLKTAGKKVWVGGNIGHPLLCEADKMSPNDYAVLELSSFQLMAMTQSPHIAVLTNLAPNHLDVHKDMAEYVAAKENIFCHQVHGDIAVFNADNDITLEQSSRASSRVRLFSRLKPVADGVYLQGESILCSHAGKQREVMRTSDIKIPGVHNVENYMAAVAAVDGLVSDEAIRQFARSFGGVEHRIELVRTYQGVRYYNDSIASSPSRTIAGLRSFPERVILIAGGYDKHIPFDVLGPEILEHVKLLILCGSAADKIRAAVENAPGYEKGRPDIIDAASLNGAAEIAKKKAKPGDVVTLSPACAAFDQFKNFAERGKVFKEIVNSWPESPDKINTKK